MAGPWLYAISDESGRGFARDKDIPLPATFVNYAALVESGEIDQDQYWFTYRNGNNVQVGDQMLIYRGGGIGIVGRATVVDKVTRDGKCYLVPDFDLALSRALLQKPIPSEVVLHKWRVVPRPNVVSLGRFESELQSLLPAMFQNRVDVGAKDLTELEIDQLLLSNDLHVGIVPTSSPEVNGRRRRGQGRIKALVQQFYGGTCAVCDVAEPPMLIASHIVGWAAEPEHQGNLCNVICLCRIHDALFEAGYWSLDADLGIRKRIPVTSNTIRDLLDGLTVFRSPSRFPPSSAFLEKHRRLAGFATSH